MLNNIVTWESLNCPPKQLDCVLRDLFCKYSNSDCLEVDVTIKNNILTVKVGQNSDSIDLTPFLDTNKISSFEINDQTGVIKITETNGAVWSINILNAIKNLETVTSFKNLITGHKIGTFVNEKNNDFDLFESVVNVKNINHVITITNENNESTTFKEGGISNDTGQIIKIGTDNLPLITCQDITDCEKNTTLDSIGVVGSDIVVKYTGETGVQQIKSMPISDICSQCSSCIEVGQTLSYTNLTKPSTGTAGQVIFVSDLLASDGSIGCLQMWQPSTNSWKKVMIT